MCPVRIVLWQEVATLTEMLELKLKVSGLKSAWRAATAELTSVRREWRAEVKTELAGAAQFVLLAPLF